jgi:hypothetical protein
MCTAIEQYKLSTDIKVTRYMYHKIHDSMNRIMKKVVTLLQSKGILYYRTQNNKILQNSFEQTDCACLNLYLQQPGYD